MFLRRFVGTDRESGAFRSEECDKPIQSCAIVSSSIEMKSSPTNTIAELEDDVLVRVEGVSKKFCRSLKRSLWYGRPAELAVAG